MHPKKLIRFFITLNVLIEIEQIKQTSQGFCLFVGVFFPTLFQAPVLVLYKICTCYRISKADWHVEFLNISICCFINSTFC